MSPIQANVPFMHSFEKTTFSLRLIVKGTHLHSDGEIVHRDVVTDLAVLSVDGGLDSSAPLPGAGMCHHPGEDEGEALLIPPVTTTEDIAGSQALEEGDLSRNLHEAEVPTDEQLGPNRNRLGRKKRGSQTPMQ